MKRFLLVSLVAAAMAMTTASKAEAAIVSSLRLTSGASTITIVDGGAGDANSLAGVITWVGQIGNWYLNISTGQASGSGSAIGPGSMDLNSVNSSNLTSTGLTIEFSQSGTAPSFPGWNLSFGGTLSNTPGGSSTVTYSAYASNTNTLFAQTSLIGTLGPFNGTAFSGNSSSGLLSVAAPYSLTQVVTLTANNSAVGYSGNASLTPVPEPGSMVLLGSGLVGLAALVRRRMRKA